MKQILLCLFLIGALNSFAQKGFFTGSFAMHFADNLGAGFGADLSGNGKIYKALYLGFGTGIATYANLDKPFFPFTGRISILPAKNFYGNIPTITLQGGYGVTADHINGPTFGGFIGVATATKGRARFNGSIGYLTTGLRDMNTYTDVFGNVVTSDERKYFGGIALKFGIMLY